MRAVMISQAASSGGETRIELGPDTGADLVLLRDRHRHAVILIANSDLELLDGCGDLISGRRVKHPKRSLTSVVGRLGGMVVVTGGYSDPDQLARSARDYLAKISTAAANRLVLIGVAAELFDERWRQASPLAPALSGAFPETATGSARPELYSLLPELPVSDNVNRRYIGTSPDAKVVRQLIVRAAARPDSVLILGDTGTGKDVVARLIHEESGRHGRFEVVNCGAIPRELFEAELFGFEKGAHSTATFAKQGLWRLANLGTLFLDEIGDLSLDHQVKVLRALEDGMIRPVGGLEAVRADVRVVAATNRALGSMVQGGTFRADLFHRLRAFMIRTPSLRDHPEDLALFIEHFWRKAAPGSDPLPPDAVTELAAYRWPGNARELKMVLSTLNTLFTGQRLSARHVRAVFQFEGQLDLEAQGPGADLRSHPAECLRHLRRADEVLRAAQIPLRDVMKGRSRVPETFAAIANETETRVQELELLCRNPSLFALIPTYEKVRVVKRNLRTFAEILRSDPEAALVQWKSGLEPDFEAALSAVFAAIDDLLKRYLN